MEADEWHRLEIFFIAEDSKENRGFGTQITVAVLAPHRTTTRLVGSVLIPLRTALRQACWAAIFWGHAFKLIPGPNEDKPSELFLSGEVCHHIEK